MNEMDKNQLWDLMTRVILSFDNKMYSQSAMNLMMGISAQETRLGVYLRQIGGGPGRGVFNMEIDTELDIWENYLAFRPLFVSKLHKITGGSYLSEYALEGNIPYQIIMTRLHLWRVKEPLAEADDINGHARYWKKHFNTKIGKGTVEQFIKNYKLLVLYGYKP